MRKQVVYMFDVAMNGQRIGTTDSVQLAKIGYVYRHLAECAGVLDWHGDERPITCDAPRLTQGQDSRPIVVSDARGRGVAESTPMSQSLEFEQPRFVGTVMP